MTPETTPAELWALLTMKVHIHPRREWREPGKATGAVRCELVLPAVDLRVDRRFYFRTAHGFAGVARFVRRQLPSSDEARIGGSFTVLVEIRAKGFGARWKRLVRWVPEDNLSSQLQLASELWARLPKEKHQECDQEDLELPDAIARLRVPPGTGGPAEKRSKR
jgi:hypothetical protein